VKTFIGVLLLAIAGLGLVGVVKLNEQAARRRITSAQDKEQ